MKTLVKQVYNIYYLFVVQIIQDINSSYSNKIVRYVMITWIFGLMLMAYTGIIFMIYMTIFGPSIGMAF
jgi:hypothetical protein